MTQKEFLKVTKNCFEKCGCISDRKRFVYDADKLYVVFILLRSNYSDCYYIDYNFSIKALHPKFTLKDDSLDFILQPRLTLINDIVQIKYLELNESDYEYSLINTIKNLIESITDNNFKFLIQLQKKGFVLEPRAQKFLSNLVV